MADERDHNKAVDPQAVDGSGDSRMRLGELPSVDAVYDALRAYMRSGESLDDSLPVDLHLALATAHELVEDFLIPDVIDIGVVVPDVEPGDLVEIVVVTAAGMHQFARVAGLLPDPEAKG